MGRMSTGKSAGALLGAVSGVLAIAGGILVRRFRHDARATQDRLAFLDRKVITTPLGHIEYAERGSGEPLLISHGIFQSCKARCCFVICFLTLESSPRPGSATWPPACRPMPLSTPAATSCSARRTPSVWPSSPASCPSRLPSHASRSWTRATQRWACRTPHASPRRSRRTSAAARSATGRRVSPPRTSSRSPKHRASAIVGRYGSCGRLARRRTRAGPCSLRAGRIAVVRASVPLSAESAHPLTNAFAIRNPWT